MGERCDSFRSRLRDRQPLVGTFIKTPSPIVADILGLSTLDAVAIDVEHAPFGRLELDQCIAALRAADMPCLVRLANDSPTEIRNALDCGATGIVVPHVTSVEQAESIAKAAHFGDGGRGFAGSPRAAGYGTKTIAEHMRDSREQTTVILQIEDPAALDHVSKIAAVDGVDCLFIGRIDLAVSLQRDVMSEEIVNVVKDVCTHSLSSGTAVGMFTPDLNELPMWRDAGASLFLLSSDQSMLLRSANQLAGSIR